ncbi:MAG: DUF4446 family protein [Candidatus Pacebacteria bacterium]|jgi:hypothetical protein|nr:DUF4446 family protein [Candidatus Paceibacterota bacterium]
MSTLLLFYILAGIIVILLVWILLIERRLRIFFSGTQAKNLEDIFTALITNIRELQEKNDATDARLTIVDKRLNTSIRSIQTRRFNPFEDAGSNQSFAISFLNDEGDGVIISSLYARDRMSIFAKPISKGTSEFDLSDEERDVLKKSQQ